MTGNYRLIDHTADFGLEIFGVDERALFEESAGALFDMLVDPVTSKGEHCRSIDITGDDWPDLMVNWLRELLYLFNGEEQIVCTVTVTSIEETRLRASVISENYDPQHHRVRNEIKAVTYHQIDVGPYKDGWRARVIFDI